MFAGRPIIGIVGGVGSGKSFVADLFAPLGCVVIHSDKLVDSAYNDAEIQREMAQWWGPQILKADGGINRTKVANIVFTDAQARDRLEGMLHPIVDRLRKEIMQEAAGDGKTKAFVWDSPLLIETGLNRKCDAVVFVEAPADLRIQRLAKARGWNREEMARREKLQEPLDKKRKISEYVIDNTADADYARGQVEDVLSRIRG